MATLSLSSFSSESLPLGWGVAEVSFWRRRDEWEDSRIEIIHLSSKERYRYQPLFQIAMTCALLFAGLFLYFPFYLVVLHLRAIFVPSFAIGRSISELVKKRTAALAWDFFRSFGRAFSLLLKEIATIAKTPICFVGLQCAALLGVASPLLGRRYFGKIERWMHETDPRTDFRNPGIGEEELLGLFFRSFIEESPPLSFYLGLCMQSLGKTTDPHVTRVTLLEPN